MSIYESNFERLVMLLPELLCPNNLFLKQAIEELFVTIDVVENHKYTTVIKISQVLPLQIPGVNQPVMLIRVCHDAKVAEVISYQGFLRFKPKYDYPNPKMHQVREKQRLNDFLGEWLDYCLLPLFRNDAVLPAQIK